MAVDVNWKKVATKCKTIDTYAETIKTKNKKLDDVMCLLYEEFQSVSVLPFYTKEASYIDNNYYRMDRCLNLNLQMEAKGSKIRY